MASLIKIKRSSGTAAPGSLSEGELAYSFGAGAQNNGGDRLYFGNGSTVDVIGGKYFTGMLDHVPGTLTGSSALLVDANSKVNNFKVDNLDFDGNTISSTNENGNIILDPNGTGSIDASSSKIINVAEPTSANDVATKSYVDTIASASLHYHLPVRVGAPTALNATYNNGTNGVGSTLTNAGTQAALVIDGITLSVSDRVLVYKQTNAAHNGVYTVTNVGSASTNWVLTRSTDTDSYAPSDTDALGTGDAFFVKEGNTGAGELYVMNTEGTITFGTTLITFVQILSAQIYSAGSGLSLDGVTFNVNVDNSSIEINADTLRVKALGITNAMLAGSITNDKLVNSTITFAAETGTADPVALGETITIAAGEGIDTTVTGNTITVAGEDASTTNKGIASFSADSFAVTNGAVTIKEGGITNAQLVNDSVTVGTTEINLGASSTTLAGLTSVTVNNLVLSGNTITSTGDLVVNVSTDIVDFSGAKLTNIGTPTANTDAATKAYVDSRTLTVDGDSTTADVNLAADDLQIRAAANLGLTSAVAKVGTDVTVTLTLAQDIRTSASPTFQDMALNGGDLTTTATTFNLVNTNATTVNFAGAANIMSVGSATSTVTFNNDVTITGDLIVNGDTVTADVATIEIEDPLIKLARGNVANLLDIGFYGQYTDVIAKFTGLFRDATDGKYKLFANGTVDNNLVTVTSLADLVVGTLEGTIDGGTYQ